MNSKILKRTLVFVSLPLLFALVRPTQAAALLTTVNDPIESYLEIPSISLDITVVVAPFVGNTWDFSNLTDVAGYFEGLPTPGEGSNSVIGAHSELDNHIPGPFYNLNQVKVNDQVIVLQNHVKYTYIITKIWYVRPTDVSPILPSKTDTLTLFTCAGYDEGVYTTRLVVRAKRIA